MAEMARRAMEKRKGVATEGSIAKRVKLLSAGEVSPLKTTSSSRAVAPSATIDMTPLSFDLSEGGLLESEGVASLPPGLSAQTTSSPSLRIDKGKSLDVGSKSSKSLIYILYH